ncbi:MAG: hypothetical protein HC896_18500 [Bacteroidales bacterium]|nr:hypothetical protein [Bacteroidales bacterium]
MAVHKRIKTYVNEVKELERLYVSVLQNIYKAEELIKVTLDNSELSKDSLQKLDIFNRKPLDSPTDKGKAKTQSSGAKKEKENKGPNSKEVSLGLFREGKSIPEIAKERGFAVSTIEGHLAHYIQQGELEVLEVMDEDKLGEIVTAAREMDSVLLSDLKSTLGEDYSYGELRMAMAFYTATLQEKGQSINT